MKFRNYTSLIAACGVSALGAYAQSTATLTGVVTDPTGAIVAHAHVTVHSLATGQDRVLDTDSAGLYAAPSLQPGDYSVTATAPGFSRFTVSKVSIDVSQTVTINMKLAVESAGETVQVESTAQQIEAGTITVGEVIDARTVQELPLNGRHFLDLTVLTPGGVVAPTAGSLTSPSRGLGANSFITAGNREDSVNFQINGINLNDIVQNQITFQPSISTTSEFKINNQTFSAEYGRSDGSIVTVATRSGTDKFHGEVFDYFRNEALDARNYFNRDFSVTGAAQVNPQTLKKAPLKRNNFGASVGGPLSHKTFFFASYEGLRQHQGILQNSTVFTAAQQQQFAANATAEPAAAALAALVPLPNSGTSNYIAFTPGPVSIDQFTGDGLHQFGQNDSLHVFYAFQKDVRTEPALGGDTIPGFGDNRAAHRQIATLTETHIFSPSLVNEFRLGGNRIGISFLPFASLNPASYGISNGFNSNVGLPFITVSDIGLTFGGPSGEPQGRTDSLGAVADTLTLLRGKNTIKTGVEYRRYLNANFAGNIGAITFVSTPNNFALDNATVFSVQQSTVSSRIYDSAANGFVQDNFKLTPYLTLEAGLRFEWNGTPIEGANRFTLFNPANLTLTRVGTNGLSADAAYQQNYNYEPRVGLAADVFRNGKTIVRGGYGYLVDQPVSGVVTALASNPPFTASTSYNGAAIPLSTLLASAKTVGGSAISYTNPNFRNAYVEDYNLNVQQDFGLGLVGSVGYYGSGGHHLLITTNANQANGTSLTHPYTALSATSPVSPGASINSNIAERNSTGYSHYNALWATLGKSFTSGVQFNVNYNWSKSQDINSLGSQGGFVLPDSNNPNENYGLSDFDVRNHVAGTAIYALPFKRNRLLAGYRLETIVQYQTGNPINITAGSSNFNGITGLVRPSLIGRYTTGRQQVSGLANVTFIQNPAGTVCYTTNTTPSCVFQVQGSQATNGTATTTTYTGLGNIQRNAITGPSFTDVDLSGEKETKIFEGLTFILRADAFDILNHPNFGQPSGNVQSSTFGQITATRFATSDGGSSRQLQLSGKFTF